MSSPSIETSIETNVEQRLPSYENIGINLGMSKQVKRKTSAKQAVKKELFATMSLWLQRSQQRKQLTRLDQYQRDDIGLTAEMIAKEVAKPFWK